MEEKEGKLRFILDVHELKGISVILVEHNMSVVMEVVDRFVVLDSGKKVAEGTSETSENG